MNKGNLLNLARAVREAPVPQNFDMSRYVHRCGTPACAFGHYAARTDLQSVFSINTLNDAHRWPHQGVHDTLTGAEVVLDADVVLEHFGITEGQANELFGSANDFFPDSDEDHVSRLARTCRTPAEAAAYIEQFVAERA